MRGVTLSAKVGLVFVLIALVPDSIMSASNVTPTESKALTAIRGTVKTYITAGLAKDREAVAAVCVPGRAVAKQAITDLPEMGGVEKLEPVEVYVDDRMALAVSSAIEGDRNRVGVLMFRLVKNETDKWLIDDIDFEEAANRSRKIETFQSKHPKALAWKETKVSGKRKIDIQPHLLCLRQVPNESKKPVTQIRIKSLRKGLRLKGKKIDSPAWLTVQEDVAQSDDSGLLIFSVQAAKVMEEGIHPGRIQIHIEGLPEAISVPVFLFSNVDAKTDTSNSSLAVLKALADMLQTNPFHNEDSGRGTARVRKYEKDKLTENRLLHFRFKDRLSRSDYYKVNENDEKQYVCTWSVHRKGALGYNHMQHLISIIPKPALEFYRQVGYDFNPDTYNRLFGLKRPIHETLLAIVNKTTKENKGTLGCRMDDKGVLRFSYIDHKSKKSSYFAFDITKGYRLVSYFIPIPLSFKTEWVKQGESGWYIKNATFQDGPFKTEVEIQDFQFVDDIADSEFTAEALNIPMGATVVDKIRNTHYRYGEKPKLK